MKPGRMWSNFSNCLKMEWEIPTIFQVPIGSRIDWLRPGIDEIDVNQHPASTSMWSEQPTADVAIPTLRFGCSKNYGQNQTFGIWSYPDWNSEFFFFRGGVTNNSFRERESIFHGPCSWMSINYGWWTYPSNVPPPNIKQHMSLLSGFPQIQLY